MKDINSDMKIMLEILDSREIRAKKQKDLISKYPYTLISFTLNTPGRVKNSQLYKKVHSVGMDSLLDKFKHIIVINAEVLDKPTGVEGYISLDLNALQAKKIAVEIEDTHYLGRLFDIDVFDTHFNQINRESLKLKPRKCLLCNEEAIKCIKMRNHSYEELVAHVETIALSYFKLIDNSNGNTDEKISMSEKVYLKLKDDILENKLKPGEKLVEEDLANEFKVSRTPVREALKQLDQDGLVTYYPRRGSVVSELSLKDAKELYEVREVLEGLAIKQICLNVDSKGITVLENIIEQMDKAIESNNFDKMKLLHKQWTEVTLLLTKNDLLKDYLISVSKNLERLRKISLYEPVHSIDAYYETKDIFHAIQNNDSENSEKLARLHVRNARKRFEKNLMNSN